MISIPHIIKERFMDPCQNGSQIIFGTTFKVVSMLNVRKTLPYHREDMPFSKRFYEY